jgi:hypothetical protein
MDVPATEAATDIWIGFVHTESIIEKPESKFRQYSKIRNFAELPQGVSEG